MSDRTDIDTPATTVTIPSLTEIRIQVLQRMLWVLVILGGGVASVAVFSDIRAGNFLNALFYFLAYSPLILALVLNVKFYAVKAVLTIIPIFLIAFFEIFNYGNPSVGPLYFLTAVFFTCVLLGPKAGVIAIVLTQVLLIFLAYMNVAMGILKLRPEHLWYGFPLTWLTPLLSHALLGICAVIFISYLLRRLDNSIKFANAYSTRMNSEIQKNLVVEAALRESEEKFRSVFEQSRDAVTIADEKGFVDCNSAALKLFGYESKDEFCALHPGDVSPPRQPTGEPSIDLANEHILDAIEGEAKLFEWTHRHKDGSYFPVEVQLSPFELNGKTIVQGVVRSIAERKQAETERARLATALEQAAEDIILTDTKGTIQYVNPAFEKNTGYQRDDVVGSSTRFLQSGLHEDGFYREIWETITHGQIWTGRIINKKKDGTLFTEESTISPIKNTKGTPIGYMAILRDISEQLLLEEQLRQAQKMESIGRLAGGIAHDFNNCLQAILGYSEIVLQELDPDGKAHKDLTQVIDAGNRTKELVRQLLAFSRRQVLELNKLDLGHVVQDLSYMLHRLIGEHITLTVQSAPGLSPVSADQGTIEQALVNLCINARDAMPNGGEITIRVENTVLTPAYAEEHHWAIPGDYVLLSVTDTGHGMDDEIKANIFEPFFTTKDIGKGTGLGLATVYGIIKQHNGYINVYSEIDVGTTFKIYLPILKELKEPVMESHSEPPKGGTETILLAEDENTLRLWATRVLENAGYAVFAASDGVEALQLYEAEPDKFDLLLLDIIMPNMGGQAVVEQVHKISPDQPVLFSSGYTAETTQTSFIQQEDIQLINKPYQQDELLHKIRDILDA